MTKKPTSPFISHLRKVLLQDGAGMTDGQLLACFIEHGDEAAFAALVKRHGPMVWGVCRRLLPHHASEDAFQATFLVLVRKAASIRPREMLANWLYGVAHHTALHSRRTAARRRMREMHMTQMPEPAVAEQRLWNNLQPLLDQELSRLPEKYRVAIVLCDLEGKTRKESARHLGCPEGTLAARLARGRIMLAKRLARHGLALSGGSVAAVLSQQAVSASVPSSVVSSTIKAASTFATGQAVGLISVKVATLAEGVLKAMLLKKLTIAAVLLLVAVLGAGVAGLTYHTQAAEPVAARQEAKQGNVPKAPTKKTTDEKGDDKTKALIERALKREQEGNAYHHSQESLALCVKVLQVVARNPKAFTPDERLYWKEQAGFHVTVLEGLLPRLEKGEPIEAYTMPFDANKVRRLVERAKKLLDQLNRADTPNKDSPGGKEKKG